MCTVTWKDKELLAPQFFKFGYERCHLCQLRREYIFSWKIQLALTKAILSSHLTDWSDMTLWFQPKHVTDTFNGTVVVFPYVTYFQQNSYYVTGFALLFYAVAYMNILQWIQKNYLPVSKDFALELGITMPVTMDGWDVASHQWKP